MTYEETCPHKVYHFLDLVHKPNENVEIEIPDYIMNSMVELLYPHMVEFIGSQNDSD